MCQVVPRRVLQLAPGRVQVDGDRDPAWVDATFVPGLGIGDYVVVYAGQAIERMTLEEAENVLTLYRELDELLQEASP